MAVRVALYSANMRVAEGRPRRVQRDAEVVRLLLADQLPQHRAEDQHRVARHAPGRGEVARPRGRRGRCASARRRCRSSHGSGSRRTPAGRRATRAPRTHRRRRSRGPRRCGGGSRPGTPRARVARARVATRAGIGPGQLQRVGRARAEQAQGGGDAAQEPVVLAQRGARSAPAGRPTRARPASAAAVRGARGPRDARRRGRSCSAWARNSTSTSPPRPNLTCQRPGVSLPSSTSMRVRTSRISLSALRRQRRAVHEPPQRRPHRAAEAADRRGRAARASASAAPRGRRGPHSTVAARRARPRSRCPCCRGAGAGRPAKATPAGVMSPSAPASRSTAPL